MTNPLCNYYKMNKNNEGKNRDQLLQSRLKLHLLFILFFVMQQQNEQKTMYIKFPTVTKLQYPSQLHADTTFRSTQSFRQNFVRRGQIKLDLIRAAQEFKIVQLPQRGEIINICTMTVRGKDRSSSPGSAEGEKLLKKKVYSVSKLNTLSVKPQSEGSTQTTLKFRSGSIKDIRKLTLPPQIAFDYFEVYPQVARLIALSFGVSVVNEGVHKLRKGKVEGSNNGLLVRHAIKKRIWWTFCAEEQQKAPIKKEDGEVKINFMWGSQILPKRQLERAIQNNEACLRKCQQREQEKPFFQRSFDKILNQLPKIKQLFFTEWEQQPTRLKDWISKLQKQQHTFLLFPDDLLLTNHLPNHWEITNKKLLYKNMVDYYKSINRNPHSRLPKTHHITCFNWQAVVKELRGEQKVWILKPGEFTNRGNGISIFRSTKEALQSILHNPPKSQERTFLLQEYISPLLYQQRKFDIRCYMLGVQVGGCLKFYWYQQGYIRTASQKFTTKKISKGIHLTNDAVQKNLPNYDKFQSANKLSYSELDKYCLNHTTFNFYNEILPQMKKIARDICHAVGDTRLIGAGKGVNFQVFGLDFLVDETGKPWLCEVNTNPSLEICSSLLSRIIPELIQNTFRLVVDIVLPPKKTPEYAQNFLTNNKYSLIYSSVVEK